MGIYQIYLTFNLSFYYIREQDFRFSHRILIYRNRKLVNKVEKLKPSNSNKRKLPTKNALLLIDIQQKIIAPIYNKLIKNKFVIKNRLVSKKDIIFVGTPEEYENVKNL